MPGDATLEALCRGLPSDFVHEKMWIVMPAASDDRIGLYFEPLVAAAARHGIDHLARAKWVFGIPPLVNRVG